MDISHSKRTHDEEFGIDEHNEVEDGNMNIMGKGGKSTKEGTACGGVAHQTRKCPTPWSSSAQINQCSRSGGERHMDHKGANDRDAVGSCKC